MASVVADTHTAIWYLLEPTKLSRAAEDTLDATSAAGDPIFLASISLVETCYLVEHARLPRNVLERLYAALVGPDAPFALAPLDAAVARAVERVPRTEVPDMPDRVIGATALALDVPLVTRDDRLRASVVRTIW